MKYGRALSLAFNANLRFIRMRKGKIADVILLSAINFWLDLPFSNFLFTAYNKFHKRPTTFVSASSVASFLKAAEKLFYV